MHITSCTDEIELDALDEVRRIAAFSCRQTSSPFPAEHWKLTFDHPDLAQTAKTARVLGSCGYRIISARQVGEELSLLFARCQDKLMSIAVPMPFTAAADALLRCPRGLFLAMFGPDGVGKSSVLSATFATLSPLFDHQRTACWRPQILSSRIAKEPHKFKLPHEISMHSPLVSMAKLTGTFLDFALDRATITRNLLRGSSLIAWDRYFPDFSVDAKRYRYTGPAWYSRFLLRSLRPPEQFLGIVLDADENVILRRKQELSLPELRRQLAAYRQLSIDLPHTYVVKNDGELADCLREVLVLAINRMASWYEPVAADLLSACGASAGSKHEAHMEVGKSSGEGVGKAVWSRARKWATRGAFAVIDQAFISGAHFVLGIHLARYLNQESYGAYALAFSILSLLATLHQAIVLEPLSVFGGARYRSSLKNYLGRLLGLQTVSSIVSLVVLFVAAGIVYLASPSREITFCLLGAAVATPSSLLLAFTRRALYLEYRSSTAAAGAVLYSVLLFSAVWLLHHLGWFSALTAFLAIAAAGLLASILLLLRIGPEKSGGVYHLHLPVVKEHWHYGRWALGSSIFTWISWNSWYTILGSSSGLADTGALKALLNLVMPVTQSCAALSLLVLPYTSHIAHAEGWAGAKRQAITVGSLFTAGAALYWADHSCVSRPAHRVFIHGEV